MRDPKKKNSHRGPRRREAATPTNLNEGTILIFVVVGFQSPYSEAFLWIQQSRRRRSTVSPVGFRCRLPTTGCPLPSPVLCWHHRIIKSLSFDLLLAELLGCVGSKASSLRWTRGLSTRSRQRVGLGTELRRKRRAAASVTPTVHHRPLHLPLLPVRHHQSSRRSTPS